MSTPKNIDANTLRTWLSEKKAIFIDVREQYEYDEEHIPGSLLFPLSNFDPSSIPHDPTKNIVFQCKSGGRSSRACHLFSNLHPDTKAYNLDGGIIAWKDAGLPVKK